MTQEFPWPVLSEWMDGQGLPAGPIVAPAILSGGTQNLLVRFARGDRQYVFRRGPEHLRPTSNDAIRREIRVLGALASTDVPHPRLVAACPDPDVLGGASFYLMEMVKGFNATGELPTLHANDARVRHAMGLSAADALAALGRVDHVAVGLEDFGRPEGFLERQVPRWLRELESHRSTPVYGGTDLPGVAGVADWLEANRPAFYQPGISHGDFHLANLLYSYEGPQVAAIIDWEMSTIGDPLLDLGWLLVTMTTETHLLDGVVGGEGGLPSPEEIVARYAAGSSRDLSAISWYEVLACFKLGIVLEGTHARSLAGQAPPEVGSKLHSYAHALFRRACTRIERD